MPGLNNAAVLKRFMIFSGLTAVELNELARLVEPHYLHEGEAFFWEDDAPEFLYLLAEGKVKVVKHSSSGKDFIVSFFNPGEMFGEVAVFEQMPYPASAIAVEDSMALGIKRNDLLDFLSRRPEVALRIINILGGRLRDAQSRLRDLAAERVEQRLARTLIRLSSRLGKTLPFTRQDVAEMAGTTTETTIRFLSGLNNRKIIHSTRGKITILDRDKLKLLSEGPPPLQ